jgi:sortase A
MANKKNLIIITLFALWSLALGIVLYLILLPFYPGWKYEYKAVTSVNIDYKDEATIKEETLQAAAKLPDNEDSVSPNRLIIPKIGVNAPIVESKSADYGLSQGAWLVPNTSTPDKGGNTVITGHRFKYLPPHNLTFFLFDRLEAGDTFSIIWNNEFYYYRIKDTEIIEPTKVSILDHTAEPIVTLYTCHPVYSTKQRLVVVGELIGEESK